MNLNLKLLGLALIGLSAASPSLAGSIVKAKYAGEFMATGVGARALGMGGAYVAISQDVTAGYWNPACLSAIEYPQISGMYAQQFANIVNYNYAAAAVPFGARSGFALSMARLGTDDIPDTRNALLDYGMDGIPNTGDEGEGDGEINAGERLDPNQVIYFNSAYYAFYLSYGNRQSERFSYGGNVKIIHEGIGENSAVGIGFDLACLWEPHPRMNIGVNLQDITTTLLIWDTGRQEAITPTSKLGVAYFWESSIIAGQLIPTADVDIRFENRQSASQAHMGPVSFDFHAGLEYQFRKLLALRLGSDTGRFSAGVGVKLPKLNVDYAFLSHDELGDTHRISLILTIEEQRFRRRHP
ncbi:MAG: PorV/PorQ family protein [Candidatus Zhuqueibacterota bacterium]